MTLITLMTVMTMRNLHPTPEWYAEGVRWIGSLFQGTSTEFDRPSFARSPDEPRPEYLAPEEFMFDVRTRMLSHL